MLEHLGKMWMLALAVLARPALATPIGWHDATSTQGAAGWTCDTANFAASINVDVFDQFGYVGSTTANAFRGDVGAAGVCGGTSAHGFNFSFAQAVRNVHDNQTHTFYAYGAGLAGGDFLLSGSPQSIFMPGDNPAYGWQDATNAQVVAGWTCDVDNVNNSLTVSVYDDVGLIGQTIANAPRSDLSGVCGGNISHGFNFLWTQAIRNVHDGQSHRIFVYATDGETGQQILLSGSPQTVVIPAPPQTTVALAAPSCGIAFSTGEQYRDPPGQGPGTNGILFDRWFMLARWQGAHEFDFVNHAVAYDVGAFTGLHGGTQRGVTPEQAEGSAAVQNSCTTSAMLINSWTGPHRPVTGGWADDMLGYAFSNEVRPFTAGGQPSWLVLKAAIAVPVFSWTRNTTRAPTVDPGIAQLGFFAYLRDKRADHAAAPPIAVLAFTHVSNAGDFDVGSGRDYEANGSDEKNSTNFAKAAYPYWYQNTAAGDGVCFLATPVSTAHTTYATPMPDNVGQYVPNMAQVFNPNAPLTPYSVAITPTNLTQIVARINDGTQTYCPFKPSGGYSSDPADWALEYAGIIAEAPVFTDQRLSPTDPGNYDATRDSWGGNPAGPTPYADHSKDQVAFGVRIDSPGIYRYFP